ncbi:hypothetical protein LHV56_12055 [Peribacillus frigoritolerans]|uniref:hypothetical protein n=1 Tax=Peribacillus frigoritolerans TaxID=450367 RepID=UPI00207A3885|nr:hypothetical protein [Peribacillus frigoritolerans]USK82566.1 hypothetical protein LHV56_12055 [Peribacillus frigoritolerans]
MEAEIYCTDGIMGSNAPITDIDVLSLIPNNYGKMKLVLGDCKTLKSQSPIARAFWMSGLMNWVGAEKGFIILGKDIKQEDHKLAASKINVSLLSEKDFEVYANSTNPNYKVVQSAILSLETWDEYLALPKRFVHLKPFIEFVKNGFWNIPDYRAQLRHTLLKIREAKSELNPDNKMHIGLFADLIALFSIAMSHTVTEIFNQYLLPESQEKLSENLKVVIWGGMENYNYYNSLYTYVKNSNESDLRLPEWDSFVQLTRQCLEQPFSVSYVPLIMREIAFEFLNNNNQDWNFSKQLAVNNRQAAKFALLITEYVCKATKVSSEFKEVLVNRLLSIQA